MEALWKYLPEGAAPWAGSLLEGYSVLVKVKRKRDSKFGDYRRLGKEWEHQITINHDLNQYAFLVTFLHEVAHMYAYGKKGRKRILPHGPEWQRAFSDLLKEALKRNHFPPEVAQAVEKRLGQPAASSCADPELYKALRTFDEGRAALPHLEELPEGAVFRFRGNLYQKGKLLRKRIRCHILPDLRTFLFSPLAEVERVEDNENTISLDVPQPVANIITVSRIGEGSRFRYGEHGVFIRGAKIRTRYECDHEATGKTYLFRGATTVDVIANE